MDVSECIEGRTSIRVFKPDPIDDSIVVEAMRMANLAPSAGNLQARDFVVVNSVLTKKELSAAAYGQDFIRTAPTVIACCANLDRIKHYGPRGMTLYCLQDVAASIENVMLYLYSKGIGSVWVGSFDEHKAASVLGLPKHARPVALIPVGYPAEKGVRRKRLAFGEYVHRDKW